MRFYEFCESLHVSNNVALQKDFSLWRQSQTLAAQKLMNAQRGLYTALQATLLIFAYLCVHLGLKTRPKSAQALIQAMQQEHQEQQTGKALKLASQNTTTNQSESPQTLNPGA